MTADLRHGTLAALLGLLLPCYGCGRSTDGPQVKRLVSLTAAARALEVDRAKLRPIVRVSRPAGIDWTLEGALASELGNAAVELSAEAELTARASLPIRSGVSYALTLTVEGAPATLKYREADCGLGADEARCCEAAGPPSWEHAVSRSGGATTVFSGRTGVAGNRLCLKLSAKGTVRILDAEVREAIARGLLQRFSAEDVWVRSLVRRPVEGGSLAMEALLATGESRYEWGPELFDGAVGRTLTWASALVPRDGEDGGSVEMFVEVRSAAGWRRIASVVRGAAGDDRRWHRHVISFPETGGLRLLTRPHRASSGMTVAWGGLQLSRHAAGRLPDVMLISLDAVRPDQLGLFGSRERLTPTLDRLGSAGAIFTEARAARGQTWESLIAVAAARPPEAVGVLDRGDLPDRDVGGFVDAFAASGYRTIRIGNFLVPPGLLGGFEEELVTRTDPQTLALARAELTARRDRPLFLWVHLIAAHYPFSPTPEFRPAGMTLPSRRDFFATVARSGPPEELARLLRLYQGCVRQHDAAVASLVRLLEEGSGRGGPPIVAVFSDHGTHLGQQGLWFLHSTLHRSSLHVPLIFHSRGRIPRARIDRLVRTIDIGPTLLEYAGVPAPPFEGRSLRPLIASTPDPARTNVVQLPGLRIVAVENDRFKLIAPASVLRQLWSESTPPIGLLIDLQLYDWRTDPSEARNLARREPLIVGELWRQMTAPGATVERAMPPEVRRLLEQAGYSRPKP